MFNQYRDPFSKEGIRAARACNPHSWIGIGRDASGRPLFSNRKIPSTDMKIPNQSYGCGLYNAPLETLPVPPQWYYEQIAQSQYTNPCVFSQEKSDNNNEEKMDNEFKTKFALNFEEFVDENIYIPCNSIYCDGIEIEIKPNGVVNLEKDEETGNYKVVKIDAKFSSEDIKDIESYKEALIKGLIYSKAARQFYYKYDCIRLFLESKSKKGIKTGLKMFLEKEFMDDEFDIIDINDSKIEDNIFAGKITLKYKSKYEFEILLKIYLENNYPACFKFIDENEKIEHMFKGDILKQFLLDRIITKLN